MHHSEENKRDFSKKQSLDFKLLSFLCPFVGIYLLCQHRSPIQKNTKTQVALCSWSVVWAFLISGTMSSFFALGIQNGSAAQLPTTEVIQAEGKLTEIVAKQADVTTNDESESNSDTTEDAQTSSKQNNQTGSISSDSKSEATTTDSSDVMSGITIMEAENVSYEREQYQPSWSVGSGCDIRSQLLTSTSLVTVQYGSKGCTVEYGSWYDPYTGETLTGDPYQGDGLENDLDIDHIIPLKYVNSHGGYYWSDTQKRAYGASMSALNFGVYVAVSASENRKKSDKGPSEYYPPNSAYRCEYAQKWRDIARKYNIGLSSADYTVVKNVLISCGIN